MRHIMTASRRQMLLRSCGASLLLLPSGIQTGWSQGGVTGDDALPQLPADLASHSAEPDYFDLRTDIEVLGTAKPLPQEMKIARDVLANAPFNTKPIDVARYFRDVGQGIYGSQFQPYVRGWPVRYNPVIVLFFKATGLNPLDPNQDGDGTSWCAAFVNWCIARALSKSGDVPADVMSFKFSDGLLSKGTFSASSGSFRCWGSDTSPKPTHGDVVVWALDGTVSGCKPGSGHVAFFDANGQGGGYQVVGGNQRDSGSGQSAVTRSTIGPSFTRLIGGQSIPVRFHSVRTEAFL
jgi:hypothetical protein